MSTAALMQLGKDEFARICDGKVPSLDSVLTLGQFVMDQLKVEGVPTTALAERTVETVGEIMTAAVAAAEDVPAELRALVDDYATVAGPALLVAVSGVQAVAAAVAAPDGSVPRWKAVMLALLGVVGGIVKGCMNARAVAVAGPVAAAADAPTATEEPPHDMRLVVDPKAPPASPSDAPTPPPTPAEVPVETPQEPSAE